MRSTIFSILLLIFAPLLNAGTIDPNIPDNKYIEFAKKFSCIVKLCGVYKDGTLFCASGVAIKENWVVTAAHVVENAKNAKVIDDTKTEHIVDDILIHPEFDTNKMNGNDIAVLHVETKMNVEYYPELYEAEDEAGKLCAISGYGLTGNFNTGSKLSDDKKRAGSNYIDKIGYNESLIVCSPSMNSNDKKTALEFMIASGDSGGGLFIDKKLAGINSCVFASDKKPNSSYTDESGHTRISKHRKWIMELIK